MFNRSSETDEAGAGEAQVLAAAPAAGCIRCGGGDTGVGARCAVAGTERKQEGETWTTIRELPYDLCGDRHKAEYLNAEGDLIVSFRQIIPEKPGPLSVMSRLGDGWYAWVGNIADILSYADDDPDNDTLGDMLIEVGSAPNLDNGYSGVIVKNGTVNLVSYGYFLEGAVNPCIMSCTFSATLFGE